MNTAVVMLSKSPSADLCKTRMTNVLTQQQANDLQAALIQDILVHVLPEQGYDFWIAVPRQESLFYFELFTSRLLIQHGNDLGEKMENLTSHLFSSGYDDVILIGSDMPLITSEVLWETIKHLNSYDCVIGPAYDGGYYLIGFRRMVPEVFHNIQWSTGNVLRESIEALKKTCTSYTLLPEQRDVDCWADILYYKRDSYTSRLPNTTKWIQTMAIEID